MFKPEHSVYRVEVCCIPGKSHVYVDDPSIDIHPGTSQTKTSQVKSPFYLQNAAFRT